MKKRFEAWLRNLVWEETQRASAHFKVSPSQTDMIVQLVLDLHDGGNYPLTASGVAVSRDY